MTRFFKFLCSAVRTFSPKMTITWETEWDGKPSVFCCNHAGAYGPIDMCAQFPLADNCRPWLNADMMDPKAVPAYVRQDYWWRPGSFFAPLFNCTLPYIAAAILPPILRGAEGVPVYHDARGIKTFKQSIRHLKNGEHLIIFPEQPSGFNAHHAALNEGFLQLAPLVYRTLGIALNFYPVHIDHKKHTFTVSAPIAYDPAIPLDGQIPAITAVIRNGI